MKITVSIKVRNPEWYWPKERLAESNQNGSISRKEWEMLNEDKIPKNSTELDFEFLFDVKSYVEKKDSDFFLTIYTSNNDNKKFPAIHNIKLKNVRVVGFIGDKNESYVIISDELIHRVTHDKMGSDEKLYWHFFLKENSKPVCLSDNIWLSVSEFEKISHRFGKFAIEMDRNIKIKKLSGPLAVNPLNRSLKDL